MTTITSGAGRWAREHSKSIQLGYVAFPRQEQFHQSDAKYRLFGGAAGPGKSKALLMEAILQADENPGANTLVLRRTFPELEQSLLLYFRRDVPRELYRSFNESKHVVTWHNGSTTRFGYCQNESDVYQYQGAEFLFIGIDELTLFTLRQWQFLTSRNRCPIPGTTPKMAGATNPGNIGHAWVKALWIDKVPAPGMDNPAAYDPADYDFIAARVSDNPIYAQDENYLKTLRALPTHLKRAFLDGDWEVFAGQYFDNFDYARHVIRAEQLDWKAWWPRWISIDWGFEHPAAIYWHAAIPNEAKGPHRVISYREWVTHRTSPRELAREIVRRSVHSETSEASLARETAGASSRTPQISASHSSATPEKIEAICLSPDAFARRTDEASIAEQMRDIFAAAGLPHPIPADDDRIGGWMLMYQMLGAGARRGPQVDGESSVGDVSWLLTENCVELIRTLPNLVRDPARVEDIEKMDGDDPADAARYGLKSRYAAYRGGPDGWRSRMPLADRISSHAYSGDPTIRAMQVRKFSLDERRGVGPVSFFPRRGRR